jgi:succinylarginine dihydrolase
MSAWEVNFDCLVGPTHNYGGLSAGNIASVANAMAASSPREAALQGLAKMKLLADMGIKQAVLPPQDRPAIATLKKLGFDGDDISIIRRAAAVAPGLLRACCSASSMWAANAATISPSADTEDSKVHITAANLTSQFHRSIEPPATAATLKRVFGDERYFQHHDPLPPNLYCADEGAANHMRLCADHGVAGVEIFVFGRSAHPEDPKPVKFAARQSLEASEAVSRLHRIKPGKMLFVQQNPAAIDAGAFHNDVLAVSNCNVMLYHESAFGDWRQMEENINRACEYPVQFIRATEADISLSEAISTYLFNSQLISMPGGGMMILAPGECQESQPAAAFLERIVVDEDNPVYRVEYVNLRQSMRNGGGPACLRLRAVLTEVEFASVRQTSRVVLDQALYNLLKAWIERHYRERILPADVADPSLLSESRTALDELSGILSLGPIYEFQKPWL